MSRGRRMEAVIHLIRTRALPSATYGAAQLRKVSERNRSGTHRACGARSDRLGHNFGPGMCVLHPGCLAISETGGSGKGKMHGLSGGALPGPLAGEQALPNSGVPASPSSCSPT